MHIPKVAGQSIETLFLEDLGLDWGHRQELLMRKKKPHELGPHRLAHLRAKDYVSLGYTDAETFDSFFTFSFVRNPYTRVLSLYHYLGYSRIISLVAFIEKVLTKKVEEDHFFYQSQYDYLYDDNGKLLVDYVGKLEQISENMEYVLKKAGLQGKKMPHVNKSDKGLKRGFTSLISNPSLLLNLKCSKVFSKKKVKELSSIEKDAIYQLYSKDFEHFAYEK
ncbi:MAG: sulfotransferase family 2 domain-containing protein [Flavobacteriaceae bacterium]|nr:sulfotransferase family 2 domain-containing protein [Flavobacteriaceae bacterium]